MKRKAQMLVNKATSIADAIGHQPEEKFESREVTNGLLTSLLLTLGAILVELDKDEPYGGA